MRIATLKNLLGVAVCSLCLTLIAPALAQNLDKLKIRLDWNTWASQAAFLLAMEKGWYKQAGLDVTMEDGNGSVTTVQIVGSSDSFDLGYASLASMMIARDKGLPVKAVAVFARQSDIGLLVPVGSGLKGPKDLKGKQLSYTAGSLEAPFIDAFLAAGGLKKSDLHLVNVDASGKVAQYGAGRSDGVFSTIPAVLPWVSATRPSEAIRFADYGLIMPSFGVFASEKKLKEKGDAIARFASVSSAAWQYIYDGNEDEAADAMLKQRPHARLDRKAMRGQIDVLKGFMFSPAAAGKPIGVMVESEWDAAVKTLTGVGVIKAGYKGSEFYEAGMVQPVAFIKGQNK